jgi:hypothetical protein
MSEKKRLEALRELARRAHESADGKPDEIDEQIDEYERRYELDSRTMLELLAAGEIAETDEISDWLWLLNFRRDKLS